ncbi:MULTISPECIES: P-loop domain-containing protein [Bacillus cereus group]
MLFYLYIIEKLFSISNLGERFSKSTFESFLDRNGSETVYKVGVKYVKTFKEWNGESLMLWGEPGNGKTHLAAAIVNELSKKDISYYFKVFQNYYNVFAVRSIVKIRKMKRKL